MNTFRTINSFSNEPTNALSGTKINSISLSRTSKGYLCKWDCDITGVKHFIKSGEYRFFKFSDTQPLSELLASRVAKVMGISCVETFIDRIDLTVQEGEVIPRVLVSYTKDFLNSNESYIPIIKLLSDKDIRSNNLYELLITKFPDYKIRVDEMILFDFLINNVDRHLGNFGFIFEESKLKDFCTIYDNGESFYTSDTITEEMITNYSRYDRDSESKPFRSKHYKQIKLIDESSLKHINLDIRIDDLLEDLQMPKERKEFISKTFNRRLSYAKDLLCKV
ncbi:MAG: hypothetical protein ACRC5M_02505 [Anaeroplasmataceae bacterium]